MSSAKCPNCSLTNFATAQFCKRCNLALNQPPANRVQTETRIFTPANNTHIRQMPPVQQNEPSNGNQPFYQNNQPNYYPSNNQQNNQQGYQPNQNYQQNYQPNQNRQRAYQPPPDSYALPKFPQGQRPSQYNSYGNNSYGGNSFQKPSRFGSGEVEYRRLGSEIALHKNATLPEICVKCGKTFFSHDEGGYVPQKFRWHTPYIYLALFLSPLIYAILASCLSENFTLNIPLCREHIEKRESLKNSLIVGGLISLSATVISGIFGSFAFAFLIFMVSAIVIILTAEYSYKILKVKNIEGSYYNLTGASNEFLESLPY